MVEGFWGIVNYQSIVAQLVWAKKRVWHSIAKVECLVNYKDVSGSVPRVIPSSGNAGDGDIL
jgi:hypothetical protein